MEVEGGGSARAGEEEDWRSGPMALLLESVRKNTPVLIFCRNNHKLLARVKAFDRHFNMVLENVKDLWTEVQRGSGTDGEGGRSKAVTRDRYIAKMFLRGDSVVLVLRDPMAATAKAAELPT